VNLAIDIKDSASGGNGRPVRRRRPGCVRIGATAALLVACWSDFLLLALGQRTGSPWPHLFALLIGLTALLWPQDRRPAWLTPQLRTGLPALAAGANVLILTVTGRSGGFGYGQATVLLCLLVIAVRTCPPTWAMVCGLLDGVVLLALPVPYYLADPDDGAAGLYLGIIVVLLLLAGSAAGMAAYLRTLDHRRAQAVTDTRRAERLAMAADLHDFVAHHVTGILVQTQVARMMATTEPEHIDPVLASIEGAAAQALASMRRTVGVLRDHDDPGETADQRPPGDLAALTDLVDQFDGIGGVDGNRAVLHRAPSVPDDLPYEIQAAAFRVVQESLTNIRRHAADATAVTVTLHHAHGRLEVAVRDNGRGGAGLPEAARGGGFGLVGLNERVTALGGRIQARPRENAHGWEVVAVLPAARVDIR
jgi:signal transduction histidine kinase